VTVIRIIRKLVNKYELVKLVTEVIGLPRSVIGYSEMMNGTVIKEEIEDEDSKNDITLIS